MSPDGSLPEDFREKASEFDPGDFAEDLRIIERNEFKHFLEGGQAVNVWAEVYSEANPRIASLAPFTSKDCDIWVSYELLQRIETILSGKLVRAESPVDGQVGIFILTGEPPKTIDLLDGVFGLSQVELLRAWERSLVVEGVRIIDPLLLFKGKCHNYVQLPQGNRNDGHHLRILIELLPCHLEMLVGACKNGEITERSLLMELKLLLGFKGDKWVRQALEGMGSTIHRTFPVELLTGCGLEKIERFAERTFG